LLTAWSVTGAFAQNDWAKYQPRTLKEIVSVFWLMPDKRGKPTFLT
jgi:hypothetical protein